MKQFGPAAALWLVCASLCLHSVRPQEPSVVCFTEDFETGRPLFLNVSCNPAAFNGSFLVKNYDNFSFAGSPGSSKYLTSIPGTTNCLRTVPMAQTPHWTEARVHYMAYYSGPGSYSKSAYFWLHDKIYYFHFGNRMEWKVSTPVTFAHQSGGFLSFVNQLMPYQLHLIIDKIEVLARNRSVCEYLYEGKPITTTPLPTTEETTTPEIWTTTSNPTATSSWSTASIPNTESPSTTTLFPSTTPPPKTCSKVVTKRIVTTSEVTYEWAPVNGTCRNDFIQE